MQIVALILCINTIFFSFTDGTADLKSEELIKKLRVVFEKWKTGSEITPGVHFPALNNLRIKPLEGNFRRPGVYMHYTVSDMALDGLDNFNIENISVKESNSTLEASVVLGLPEVTMFAENYSISGRAWLLVPLSGSGPLTITLEDVKLLVSIRLGKSIAAGKEGMNTEGFSFDFRIGKVETDLSDTSWGVSQYLSSDGGKGFIENNHQDIIKAVKNAVVNSANFYLRSMTKNDILNALDAAVKE